MPRLTEQEKQEIVRFLEADRALPDRYRFLLFDDKREVELVWNGKTAEVTGVVLPFQTIEQIDEPRTETGDGSGRSRSRLDSSPSRKRKRPERSGKNTGPATTSSRTSGSPSAPRRTANSNTRVPTTSANTPSQERQRPEPRC